MGAWGYGSFDNYGALDFFEELEYSLWECIDDTLGQIQRVVEDEGDPPLSADDGAAIVTIGELLAAALGRPGVGAPHNATTVASLLYLEEAARRVPTLLDALEVVVDPAASVLADQWAEGHPDAFEGWLAAIDELRHRLYASLSALSEAA